MGRFKPEKGSGGRFVVGDDLRDNSELPLTVAADWAQAFEKELLVLHGDRLADTKTLDTVLTRMNLEVGKNYAQNLLQANTETLRKQVEKLGGSKEKIVCESRPGNGAEVLLEEVRSPEVELVILGYNPKRTLREVFLGTVTEELIHKSTCSLMIVKNIEARSPKNIMVAYDFSHHCDQSLKWAKALYGRFESKTHLVNVVPCFYQGYHSDIAAKGELNQKIEEMIEENIHQAEAKLQKKVRELEDGTFPVTGATVLDKKGSISDKLVDYVRQEEIDLVLMGSHMRGKIKELFLGSVASGLLKKTPCSILVSK